MRSRDEVPDFIKHGFAVLYVKAAEVRALSADIAMLLDDVHSAVWAMGDGDNLGTKGDRAVDRICSELGLGPINDQLDRAVALLMDHHAVHEAPRPVRPWPATAWPIGGDHAGE